MYEFCNAGRHRSSTYCNLILARDRDYVVFGYVYSNVAVMVMAGDDNEDSSDYAHEDEPVPQMPQATRVSASARLATLRSKQPRDFATGHAATVKTATQVPIMSKSHSNLDLFNI